ncbi:MAG: HNH/ENDO VII family nuclease [Mycobacterium sp.]
MAGTDTGAHQFATKYDTLVGGGASGAGLMEAATSAIMGAAQCSDLLYATAINHQNSDEQSAINNTAAPAYPPGSAPTFLVPDIPSAEGGHSDVPEWWHTIQSYVQGEVWPNGHQDQLREAADAWHKAARELRSAGQLVNGGTSSMGAIAPLESQKSPEFPAVVKNLVAVRDSLSTVADGFDAAGDACSDFAQKIDDVHSAIIHEMLVLGGTIVVTEVIATVLIPFTAGASAAVSKVVDVARLTATGMRIATLIREFRAAAELSTLPAVSAAGTAVRTLAELSPLLTARVQLFLAEGAGVMTKEGIDLLSRPYVRVGTRAEVEAAAAKTADGRYYISATDESVLIPVSKSYDDAILNLPKTADGKYFLDAATDTRYPVNPVYHLGHTRGDEWWSIRDQAIREGWTRQELIDYCNQPRIYQIEDAPGNMSHRFELPREAR